MDLTGVVLSNVSLVKADFSHCNLTNASFTNVNFSNAVLANANLTGATFKHCTLDGADLTNCTLTNTDFTGSTLHGGDFSHCDLTSIVCDSTFIISTQTQPIVLYGATLNFGLINYNWQWLDMRNATIRQLPLSPAKQQPLLSSATLLLVATGAKLSGLNLNSLKGVTLESAVLDYSLLDGLDVSDADLTSASPIDASLHGATLTDTILTKANLSGAQLGSLGHLFTLPASAEATLDAGQASELDPFFPQNGITLSSNVTLKTLATDRVWQLNDVDNHVIYTIRLETQSDNTQVLTVYTPVAAAGLVNAYLPNATLTGANLYGVAANNIQFYGSGARIDGSAILEEAQLNDSNFSNLDLTQAQLLGANLSGAHLFNAKFNKANLTPSANGVAANLSEANLQGADFTDALLYGANLSNAAVAIPVPTKANPQQGGVYLFSLPYEGDTNTLQQYTTELGAALSQFSLNPNDDASTLQQYVTALENNDIKPLQAAFLTHQPPISLSNGAQIQTVDEHSVWQIVDQPTTYTLWTDLDNNGSTELYAAVSLVRAAFHQKNITLRGKASVAIDEANQRWLLDNDSENPQNFQLGYACFVLLKCDDTVLDVYGTAVRIERLGDNPRLQIDTEICNVTKLSAASMDKNTICTNGTTLNTNQNTAGKQWDNKWLRAATPPEPPTCVPTDYCWCSQTQTTDMSLNRDKQ